MIMRNKALSECYTLFFVRTNSSYQNVRRSYSSAPPAHVKPYASIPGLSSLPILGPLHHFLPVIGQFGPGVNIFDMMSTLHEKYGSIVKLQGVFARSDLVILYEPEHIDQVFRSQEANPLRPGFQTLEYCREVIKKGSLDGIYGLTTAQGEKWRDFRTKVNPALLKLKLVKVYAPPLEEIAQDLVQRIRRYKDDTKYLEKNFDLEITKWSLESVAYVALGSRLGCLGDDVTKDHPGFTLLQCSKDIMDLAFKLEFLPSMWKYIATPAYKKIIRTYDKQWEISTKYIEDARKRINERGYDIPEEEKSVVERLLAIDEKVAILMANEMLFAGIDTVSFVATSIIYNLARHPEKQQKLREEIRSPDSHKRYLRACLKEALRMWHVIPSNLRRTDRDHYVAGYHIPAGVDVIAPNEYMSRLEKYYPRAKEFIPERWLADKTDPLYYGNAPAIVTLPFGFGIRSCIGRRIAELEIETLIKKLFDEFEVTWEGPQIKVVTKVGNTFVEPYNFRFKSIK
uniref:Cytochrome p450 CYP333A12 n=1 Tax=Spodoptera exigua TaxID=7107 RepID=A0A248QEI9_SPOEX|nr:cytochrome p450 CYP333A12 [Spodoptera exigua]